MRRPASPTGSCSSWATRSSRSIASAGPIPTSSGSFARRFPRPAGCRCRLNFRSQPAVLEFVNALFAEELKTGRTSRSRAFRGRSAPGRPSSSSGRSSRKEESRGHERPDDVAPEASRGASRIDAAPRRPSAAAARGRLDRPAAPRPAGLGREDRVGKRGRQESARAGAPRRHRLAVPRPDRRGLLRRGPAALGHRLLPRRRPRLLRPAGNLRRGEPAARAGQSGRRGEPGGRAAEPVVRPAGRDALLAGATSGGAVGGAVRRAVCRPSWAPSRRSRSDGPPPRLPRCGP